MNVLSHPERGSPTIVVADDDEEFRELICEYLRSDGCQVLEARNGLEALLHIKRYRPRGVILDVKMPRCQGLDALIRIRAFDPQIRVVVITGLLTHEVYHRAVALGAVAVFPKPLVLGDLSVSLGLGRDN